MRIGKMSPNQDIWHSFKLLVRTIDNGFKWLQTAYLAVISNLDKLVQPSYKRTEPDSWQALGFAKQSLSLWPQTDKLNYTAGIPLSNGEHVLHLLLMLHHATNTCRSTAATPPKSKHLHAWTLLSICFFTCPALLPGPSQLLLLIWPSQL